MQLRICVNSVPLPCTRPYSIYAPLDRQMSNQSVFWFHIQIFNKSFVLAYNDSDRKRLFQVGRLDFCTIYPWSYCKRIVLSISSRGPFKANLVLLHVQSNQSESCVP